MSFGTSTSDAIVCALHVPTVLYLLYVSGVDTACPNRGQLLTTLYTGEEALLEKRP